MGRMVSFRFKDTPEDQAIADVMVRAILRKDAPPEANAVVSPLVWDTKTGAFVPQTCQGWTTPACPGLAAYRQIGEGHRGWHNIVHIGSGRGILNGLKGIDVALATLNRLGAAGVDWTQTADALAEQRPVVQAAIQQSTP